ncbi:sphingomyelinase [Leptospira noguchii]|uniref:sphingomyelinase n=1 Tax=Leptospira noguchii TaxID=28182 RepID=UPI000A2F4F76|nr:hemolysin [Leptospira noguchii]
MKMIQNILRKKEAKKWNQLINSKLFRVYYLFIFLFLFDCLPDPQSSENNLFLSLLSLPKEQSIKLTNNKSTEKSKTTRKYGWVTFTSQVTGKKIQADPERPDGWLKVDASSNADFTTFTLYQDGGDPNCIQSGPIRVEPTAYRNYYWNWWLGGGAGNYAYYPKYKDGSNKLNLYVLKVSNCLESGDRVLFSDYDIITQDDYFVIDWDGGSWNEYLFLWKKFPRIERAYFYVQLNEGPEE